MSESTITFTARDGTQSEPVSLDGLTAAAARLAGKGLIFEDIKDRVFPCTVRPAVLFKEEGNGTAQQLTGFVLNVDCTPDDLALSPLWSSAFARNAAGEVVAVEQEISKFKGRKLPFGWRFEVKLYETGDERLGPADDDEEVIDLDPADHAPQSPDEWRKFRPDNFKVDSITPVDGNRCILTLKADAFDFPLAGECWAPFRFSIRFIAPPIQTALTDFTEEQG